jgi:hypothetical protein
MQWVNHMDLVEAEVVWKVVWKVVVEVCTDSNDPNRNDDITYLLPTFLNRMLIDLSHLREGKKSKGVEVMNTEITIQIEL